MGRRGDGEKPGQLSIVHSFLPTVGVPLRLAPTRGPTAASEASPAPEAPDAHLNRNCKYLTQLDISPLPYLRQLVGRFLANPRRGRGDRLPILGRGGEYHRDDFRLAACVDLRH